MTTPNNNELIKTYKENQDLIKAMEESNDLGPQYAQIIAYTNHIKWLLTDALDDAFRAIDDLQYNAIKDALNYSPKE